ncbi:MAG: hypothetical protein EA403_04465 [Spirochaetaceae bacterium]|nr:MAG: hypothetical protein EA403_04465 [Spirochaetaceae bacterium]
MTRKLVMLLALAVLVTGAVFAQDLRIDFQYNVAAADPANNQFTFRGPIRYMAAQRDQFDVTTGASQKQSTWLFMPYLTDVRGTQAFPNGLRGLFLFAVSSDDLRVADNFQATRAANGVITVQYVHRGIAYRLVSDNQGRFVLPNGQFQRRVIGHIAAGAPQVISRDFSSDGTAATVNWAAVWNPATRSGQPTAPGSTVRTGELVNDVAAADALFSWRGQLQGSLERNILRISGGLDVVGR